MVEAELGGRPRMSRPVLSVCIPTYNRGEELAMRVRAWLAAAEGDDLEIVVSDNASTDGTDAAFAAISDPRLVYCRNEKNSGAFENQLKAFAAAHGTWLMQLTDKDEIMPSALPSALAALRGLTAVCGAFRLVRSAGDTLDGSVQVYSGAAAYARFGLAYAHPSGCFFRADVLSDGTVLKELRTLGEVMRPYSTDYLTSLCLRAGGYARIDVPFVRHNLPPYGAGRKSVSYVSRKDYYFTPEFVIREFEAYLLFLHGSIHLSPWARARAVAGLVRRSLFPRMTEIYRWMLADENICAWYGVPEDMRCSEMSRDLERDFRAGIRALARSADAVDAVALRLGAFGCSKAISRRRRKCEAK